MDKDTQQALGTVLKAVDRAWAFLASDWDHSDPVFVAAMRQEAIDELNGAERTLESLGVTR